MCVELFDQSSGVPHGPAEILHESSAAVDRHLPPVPHTAHTSNLHEHLTDRKHQDMNRSSLSDPCVPEQKNKRSKDTFR